VNADVKKEWVAALRSGEFEQAKGSLKDDDGYCCLGVLCELYRRKFGGRWERNIGGGFEYLGMVGLLPSMVVVWAGLMDKSPTAKKGGAEVSLTDMNDQGADFSKIADLIEAGL
jgi:hypothetical protein